MKKTYNVKPIDEITLAFQDGYNLILRFDAMATYRLTTEFSLDDMIENPSMTEMCAMVVYSASVENNKDITLDNARELVCQMDLETITNIVMDFEESTGIQKNENLKELQKKTMENFILNLYNKKRVK